MLNSPRPAIIIVNMTASVPVRTAFIYPMGISVLPHKEYSTATLFHFQMQGNWTTDYVRHVTAAYLQHNDSYYLASYNIHVCMKKASGLHNCGSQRVNPHSQNEVTFKLKCVIAKGPCVRIQQIE